MRYIFKILKRKGVKLEFNTRKLAFRNESKIKAFKETKAQRIYYEKICTTIYTKGNSLGKIKISDRNSDLYKE